MKFEEFDAATFNATKAAWEGDAKQGLAFAPDVSQSIGWAKDHLTIKENAIAYGVFEEESNEAVGICELVITRLDQKKVWVKVLRLRLRPRIEEQLFVNDPVGMKTAVEAYISAVLGVFAVKNSHNASTIKVYGRTKEQVSFLTLLAASLNERKDTISYIATIEGRWLVLNWK